MQLSAFDVSLFEREHIIYQSRMRDCNLQPNSGAVKASMKHNHKLQSYTGLPRDLTNQMISFTSDGMCKSIAITKRIMISNWKIMNIINKIQNS